MTLSADDLAAITRLVRDAPIPADMTAWRADLLRKVEGELALVRTAESEEWALGHANSANTGPRRGGAFRP